MHGKERGGFVTLICTCGRLPSAAVNHKFFWYLCICILGDSYLKNPNPSILAECYRGIYVSLISASSADLIWFWLFHHSSCLVCVLAVFILEATDNIFLCNI